MRFTSLASGSQGNCLVVEAGRTRVLVDCGLSLREAERRLARRGVAPEALRAVLVTHEHDDHAGGAYALAAAYGLEVVLTHGTRRALREAAPEAEDRAVASGARLRMIDARAAFAIDDLEVRPFTVPHDAREPVQYVLSDGARRLGVLTDLGAPTAHVVEMLSGSDALVLECNHALELLWGGGYPRWLKARIAGPLGHLDNAAAADLLARLDRSRLQHVFAAHLSEQNNRPALARAALAGALGCTADEVGLATQAEGFDWRALG
ncbi:MAG: MBL fold metallo-hydrolase [Burkholderiales bacterium]|nr:MBL fold metallo-hydrolase [Burkholderiales bacterium]